MVWHPGNTGKTVSARTEFCKYCGVLQVGLIAILKPAAEISWPKYYYRTMMG